MKLLVSIVVLLVVIPVAAVSAYPNPDDPDNKLTKVVYTQIDSLAGITGSVNHVGTNSESYMVTFQFDNPEVPLGANVTGAYLQLYSQTSQWKPLSLEIYLSDQNGNKTGAISKKSYTMLNTPANSNFGFTVTAVVAEHFTTSDGGMFLTVKSNSESTDHFKNFVTELGSWKKTPKLLIRYELDSVPTLSPTPSPSPSPTPTPEPVANFWTTDGAVIMDGDTEIRLRGTNIANIGALYAPNIGGIGSGDLIDIEAFENDYQKLAELGANHVRFGMSFNWYTDDRQAFLQMLDTQIEYAKAHDIRLVLNMFTTPGDCYEGYSEVCDVFWNAPEKQQELADFWVDIATVYKDEPTIAGFGLLNEPVGNATIGWSSGWYEIAQDLINQIRAVNQNHLIFVAAGPDALFPTTFSGGDIIYEVHYYEPFGVTHNYANESNSYPGYFFDEWTADGPRDVYFDKDGLMGTGDPEADLRSNYSVNWATDNNVPVYIGEWGSLTSNTDGYLTYLADMVEVLNHYGINHAHYSWEAGNSWGLHDSGSGLNIKEQAKYDIVINSLKD